tara:strand:- start:333 stop:575 length:243 start_codon:yes stop_codon:yes gene_type:complete
LLKKTLTLFNLIILPLGLIALFAICYSFYWLNNFFGPYISNGFLRWWAVIGIGLLVIAICFILVINILARFFPKEFERKK